MFVGRASWIRAAIVVALSAAQPAMAGTSSATGTVSFTVVNQCSVAGSTVNLGTFLTTQTFQDVGSVNGYFDADDNWIAGTRGTGSLNLGSITCDSGAPYSMSIQGSGPEGAIVLSVGGKSANASIWVTSIGGQAQTDEFGIGLGAYASDLTWSRPQGIGSGAPQAILGTVPLGFGYVKQANGGTANLTDQLGSPGSFADTLVYTLNF